MSQSRTPSVHAWRVRTRRQDSIRIPVTVLAGALDCPAIAGYLTADMVEAIKAVAGAEQPAEDVAVIKAAERGVAS